MLVSLPFSIALLIKKKDFCKRFFPKLHKMFRPILSDEDCKALASFKYKGAPDTFVEHWFMQPFWRWSAKFVPTWISPNAITFLGWFVMLIATAVLMYSSVICEESETIDFVRVKSFQDSFQDFIRLKKGGPAHNFLVANLEVDGYWRELVNPILDFENEVAPTTYRYSWAFLLTAFAMKFYLTMDNIDGKHARRLGFSSALGSVIDHGVDCTTSIMFALMVMFGCDIKGTLAAHPIGFLVYMFGIQTPFYLANVESAFKGNLDPAGATEGVLASMIVPLGTAFLGDNFWRDNGACWLMLGMAWIGWSVTIGTASRLLWRHGYVPCLTWWLVHIIISGKLFIDGACAEHALLVSCLIGMNFILISGGLVVRNLVSFSEDKFVEGKFVPGRKTGLWDNPIEYESCFVLLVASLCFQLLPAREYRLSSMLFILGVQVISFFFHGYTTLTAISRNLDFPIIALPTKVNPRFIIGHSKATSSSSPFQGDLLNENDDVKGYSVSAMSSGSSIEKSDERSPSGSKSNSTTDASQQDDSRSASSSGSASDEGIESSPREESLDLGEASRLSSYSSGKKIESPLNLRHRTAVVA